MTISADNREPLQYIASAGQTIFVYDFKIFEEADLAVYLTPAGQTPDPTIDLLTLNTDYTVTGVGSPTGTIVLVVPATVNDIITIESAIVQDQTVNFSVGGKFDPDTVEFVIDKLTALIQENAGILEGRGLLYQVTDQLSSTNKDNILPKLATKTTGIIPIWSKDLNDNLIATAIDENADASTLRTDLANDNNGTDGARLVGYFNNTSGADNTVKKALDNTYADIGTNATNIAANTAAIADLAQTPNPNLLYGANFGTNPWQRGVSFTAATTPANNDGTYLADRWILLSDGNDIVDVTKNAGNAMRYDVQTANKQFAAFQILENKDIQQLVDNALNISLAVKMKASVARTFRMAVVKWTGTADSPTKDCIGTWAGGGTNPTLATDWDFVSTPTDLAVTTSYQTFTDLDVGPLSSATNLGVLIWIDDTSIAGGTTWDLFSAKLEVGHKYTGEYINSYEYELTRCERYYEKSYEDGVYAGTAATFSGYVSCCLPNGKDYSSSAHPYRVRKFKVPTVNVYSPDTGAINNFWKPAVGDAGVVLSPSSSQSTTAISGYNSPAHPGPEIMWFHYTADAEIGI